MNSISIKNLTKKYGQTVAVDNISLQVESGDFFGFIGPNGAGKTTTIKSMLGLLQPNSGNIELLGENIAQNTFQEHIGLVPGEANLYGNLRVSEQIRYFAKYYNSIDTTYLNHLKKIFKLKEDKKISELSLGNKKKISIVLALMHQPKLLVFDEVTASLDPLMQKVLFEELTQVQAKGTTIFFSSHNLEEVQTYCKNIAIIRAGKIVKIDNVEKIVEGVGVQVMLKTQQKLNPGFLTKHKIKHQELSNGVITFVYKGDINELVFFASKYKLETFKITNVKLEDIFEEYY